jgi:small GTP-binding protein
MLDSWESRVGMKICLVGDAGVGKTSIIQQFVRGRFDPRYVFTLGVRYEPADLDLWLEGCPYQGSLRIWDIMGERTLRSLFVESYLDSAHGVMAVCDLTRKETLDRLEHWLALMYRVAPDAELLIVGNKADLADELEIQEPELSRFASRHMAQHLLVSAKTDTEVENAFHLLAHSILIRRLPRMAALPRF